MRKVAIIFILSIIIISCSKINKKLVVYTGYTQGSTFVIKFYSDKDSTKVKKGIDSLLYDINYTASIFDTNSIISKVNNNREYILNEHFVKLFNKAEEISKATNGCFDITVGQLVNAWGFGFKKGLIPSKALIDSLKNFIGYEKVKIVSGKVVKEFDQTKIDFNAIAQGYTVDVISEFLISNSCNDFIVEIGGEVRAKGLKENNEKWIVGIEKPAIKADDGQEIQEKIGISDKSVSTSGSTRKFYIKNGVKYSHTIDPKTGNPVTHSLLSVTVIANDCSSADAYATAFMVMGLEKSKEFLLKNKELDAYFIYADQSGKNLVYYTPGFENYLLK